MNNILILTICIIVLIIMFLIIFIIISKRKIEEIITPLEIANNEINELLKKKYQLFKKIINIIKENISLKDDAFLDFINFNSKNCNQNDLINILDKTTLELNNYVLNYEILLKNYEFINLKRKLYIIQINLESSIDYYNNHLILYNDLKEKGPTRISTFFYKFNTYENIKNEKKEISNLINLN